MERHRALGLVLGMITAVGLCGCSLPWQEKDPAPPQRSVEVEEQDVIRWQTRPSGLKYRILQAGKGRSPSAPATRRSR